jgi:flotillin
VRKPAEAEQFRVRTLAEAREFQLLTEAGGEAEAIRQPRCRRGRRRQGPRSGRSRDYPPKGLAQAEVIREQGLAEARSFASRVCEAKPPPRRPRPGSEYTQAAIIQQIIDALPEVAAAISAPLSQTERIVVISQAARAALGPRG